MERHGRTDVTIIEDAGTGDAAAIAEALAVDVAARFGPRDETPLTLVARDGAGALIGGLNGASHWRWLYIRNFWVAAHCRKAGIGRGLLAAAEAVARRRGCVGLYLDTFDPGAEAFYRKCGFDLVGRIEDFPPGHARRFLCKRLASN